VKVKVALAGQLVSGIEMVICDIWPGERVPLCELRVMPLIPLLDTVQLRSLLLFLSLITVAAQLQPLPVV